MVVLHVCVLRKVRLLSLSLQGWGGGVGDAGEEQRGRGVRDRGGQEEGWVGRVGVGPGWD